MFALSVIWTAFSFLPVAAPGDDAKAEMAKWQGTWEVELQLVGGKEQFAKDRASTKLVIKDDVWEVHLKDTQPIQGKIKIVLDGKMKGVDVTFGDTVYRSIYLMDGDRAILRVGAGNAERPKDFSTSGGADSGGIVIYKRVKQ
ncbi:MAG: hypothetical protein L0241_24995 [Planctomycetia bacterium]|nr:hypothetical protein [Planctomycetia bacterium]